MDSHMRLLAGHGRMEVRAGRDMEYGTQLHVHHINLPEEPNGESEQIFCSSGGSRCDATQYQRRAVYSTVKDPCPRGRGHADYSALSS